MHAANSNNNRMTHDSMTPTAAAASSSTTASSASMDDLPPPPEGFASSAAAAGAANSNGGGNTNLSYLTLTHSNSSSSPSPHSTPQLTTSHSYTYHAGYTNSPSSGASNSPSLTRSSSRSTRNGGTSSGADLHPPSTSLRKQTSLKSPKHFRASVVTSTIEVEAVVATRASVASREESDRRPTGSGNHMQYQQYQQQNSTSPTSRQFTYSRGSVINSTGSPPLTTSTPTHPPPPPVPSYEAYSSPKDKLAMSRTLPASLSAAAIVINSSSQQQGRQPPPPPPSSYGHSASMALLPPPPPPTMHQKKPSYIVGHKVKPVVYHSRGQSLAQQLQAEKVAAANGSKMSPPPPPQPTLKLNKSRSPPSVAGSLGKSPTTPQTPMSPVPGPPPYTPQTASWVAQNAYQQQQASNKKPTIRVRTDSDASDASMNGGSESKQPITTHTIGTVSPLLLARSTSAPKSGLPPQHHSSASSTSSLSQLSSPDRDFPSPELLSDLSTNRPGARFPQMPHSPLITYSSVVDRMPHSNPEMGRTISPISPIISARAMSPAMESVSETNGVVSEKEKDDGGGAWTTVGVVAPKPVRQNSSSHILDSPKQQRRDSRRASKSSSHHHNGHRSASRGSRTSPALTSRQPSLNRAKSSSRQSASPTMSPLQAPQRTISDGPSAAATTQQTAQPQQQQRNRGKPSRATTYAQSQPNSLPASKPSSQPNSMPTSQQTSPALGPRPAPDFDVKQQLGRTHRDSTVDIAVFTRPRGDAYTPAQPTDSYLSHALMGQERQHGHDHLFDSRLPGQSVTPGPIHSSTLPAASASEQKRLSQIASGSYHQPFIPRSHSSSMYQENPLFAAMALMAEDELSTIVAEASGGTITSYTPRSISPIPGSPELKSHNGLPGIRAESPPPISGMRTPPRQPGGRYQQQQSQQTHGQPHPTRPPFTTGINSRHTISSNTTSPTPKKLPPPLNAFARTWNPSVNGSVPNPFIAANQTTAATTTTTRDPGVPSRASTIGKPVPIADRYNYTRTQQTNEKPTTQQPQYSSSYNPSSTSMLSKTVPPPVPSWMTSNSHTNNNPSSNNNNNNNNNSNTTSTDTFSPVATTTTTTSPPPSSSGNAPSGIALALAAAKANNNSTPPSSTRTTPPPVPASHVSPPPASKSPPPVPSSHQPSSNLARSPPPVPMNRTQAIAASMQEKSSTWNAQTWNQAINTNRETSSSSSSSSTSSSGVTSPTNATSPAPTSRPPPGRVGGVNSKFAPILSPTSSSGTTTPPTTSSPLPTTRPPPGRAAPPSSATSSDTGIVPGGIVSQRLAQAKMISATSPSVLSPTNGTYAGKVTPVGSMPVGGGGGTLGGRGGGAFNFSNTPSPSSANSSSSSSTTPSSSQNNRRIGGGGTNTTPVQINTTANGLKSPPRGGVPILMGVKPYVPPSSSSSSNASMAKSVPPQSSTYLARATSGGASRAQQTENDPDGSPGPQLDHVTSARPKVRGRRSSQERPTTVSKFTPKA